MSTAQVQRLQQRLRRTLNLDSLTFVLGDGQGKIPAGMGRVWVRQIMGVDTNGQPRYSMPIDVKHNPNAQYFMINGSQVQLGHDSAGDLEVIGTSWASTTSAGYNTTLLNSGNVYTRQDRITNYASPHVNPSDNTIGANQLMYRLSDGTAQLFDPQPSDFIDPALYVPSDGEHLLIGVYIDVLTNSLDVTVGTPKPESQQLGMDDVNEVVSAMPLDAIPTGAWVVRGGQTVWRNSDLFLDLRQYINHGGGGLSSVEWGDITGDIADQTDLQGALDAKLDADDYDPVTIGVPDNGLSISGQEISLSLADNTSAGAMPPDMFEVLSTGRTYLGYEFFTSSGTFTKASYPNAKWLKVIMCGGGGGGSSTANLTQCGSGGAGSSWCLFWIDIDDISASEAVTVGAGGSAGVIGGGQGGTGGNSAFAGVTSGFGGGGGNPSVFNQGGTSYAGSGSANFRFSGSGGQSGGNIAGVGSGMGGSCAWGGGAQGRAGQSNVLGITGSPFGGGGAGGTHPSHPAGAGAQGFVLIEVYG